MALPNFVSTNIFSCDITKTLRLKYSLLQNSLKIDDLIDPRMNTVSSILKHIHKGTIETAYTILNGEYEVIEAEIIETSELINKEIKNLRMRKKYYQLKQKKLKKYLLMKKNN